MAPATAALVYVAVILWLGRDVLARLGTGIANDAGDPLLNAAILAWNARSMPWTDAWFNLPIFFPTPDALTFSEHLLGLSPVATPAYWLTGNALATYNLVLLLTFPLSALAMYALVHRLTRHAGAAFLAGLAFGFAPYRIVHMPHVQVLAAFWMPLAILALHAYLETRRKRWLAMFAVTWMLQGAANGYYLVFFSVLVGLWVMWFVVIRGLWQPLLAIGIAGVAGFLPLAPIISRYVAVHRANGFERSFGEIQGFSADVAGLLCAAPTLSMWGSLNIGCKPEGELFPGFALVVLCLAGAIVLWRGSREGETPPTIPREGTTRSRALALARVLLLAVAVVYAAISASVWVGGPWRVEFGVLRASASSVDKPLSVTIACLLVLSVMSPRLRRSVRTSSVPAFYALAALITWILALGPAPTLFGTRVLYRPPYAWLMQLPGIQGLRVPSRFWMMTVFCLAVLAGLGAAELLRRRSHRTQMVLVALLSIALLSDGWVRAFGVADAERHVPNPTAARGGIVLELPLGDPARDVFATMNAVVGGWRAVNGYSGYEPAYYAVLRAASTNEDPGMFDLLQAHGALHVVVRKDAPRLVAIVRDRANAVKTGENVEALQFRLPHVPVAHHDVRLGEKLRLGGVFPSCRPEFAQAMTDGDPRTRWECGPQSSDQSVIIELARPSLVGGVVHVLGPYSADFPRRLVIETTADAERWEPAWHGAVMGPVMEAAMKDARAMRVVLPFPPRVARLVRLRQVGRDDQIYWSVAELEVHAPSR